MITTAHWQTATVGAFFGAVPWQDSTTLLGFSSAETAVASVDWRQLTVKAFFSDIAWDGDFHPVQQGSEASAELSYLRPVQSFFGCFVWEGRPNIGVVPQLNLHPTKVPEISLNDLSDLF
jgi:hypothetical protein